MSWVVTALGVGVLVAIVVAIIAFWVWLAGQGRNIAESKGYDNRNVHAWAMCFWFGLLGFIYVMSLPDLRLRWQNDKLIELLNQQKYYDNKEE